MDDPHGVYSEFITSVVMTFFSTQLTESLINYTLSSLLVAGIK